MKLIVCVDDSSGMMFNGRRCSRDRELNKHVAGLLGGRSLWLTAYSRELFADIVSLDDIRLCDDFSSVPLGDYLFLEDAEIPSEGIEEVIVARWNRRYPADKYFPESILEGFSLLKTDEIVGSSHDKITIEHYSR